MPSPLFRIIIELSPLLMRPGSVTLHCLSPTLTHILIYVSACSPMDWTRSRVPATLLTYSRVGRTANDEMVGGSFLLSRTRHKIRVHGSTGFSFKFHRFLARPAWGKRKNLSRFCVLNTPAQIPRVHVRGCKNRFSLIHGWHGSRAVKQAKILGLHFLLFFFTSLAAYRKLCYTFVTSFSRANISSQPVYGPVWSSLNL